MILKNLIGNAFKFTDRGGVTVSAWPRDCGVEFSVADTGIGIAPADHAVIFEPFRQVPRERRELRSGAGLGLYITKRLVEMLGGTIEVESSVDRGSTFRVWLAVDTGEQDAAPSEETVAA
jgi:signal transduction histidine kinase